MCTLSLSCLHLFILIVFYYFHLVYLRLLSCERLSPNAVLGQNLLPRLNNLNAMQAKFRPKARTSELYNIVFKYMDINIFVYVV